MNGTEEDAQWEEDCEEKYVTNDESVGWGYLTK
jgi:hypothetical protein